MSTFLKHLPSNSSPCQLPSAASKPRLQVKMPRRDAKAGLGFGLLIAAVGVFFVGHLVAHGATFSLKDIIGDYYANLCCELLSIALTVLIIDHLNERRARTELLHQLVREMGSSDNSFATKAVRELRGQGWLTDGSIAGADLNAADLDSTDLTDCDLSGALLAGAEMRKICGVNGRFEAAEMPGANLEGANLRWADFSGADLQLANFTGADLTDAKFDNANLSGADFTRSNVTQDQINRSADPSSAILPVST